MKKRILMICMCFTLIVTVISKDVHETKAFAIAPVAGIGALVVGALALAGGVGVKDKNNLEMMTDDFTRFLDETLPDIASSWHELITKPITAAKVFISEKIRGAFYSYLEKKGWGQKVVNSLPIAVTSSTLFNSLVSSISDETIIDSSAVLDLENFLEKANSGEYSICSIKTFESSERKVTVFFLLPVNVTDIYTYKADNGSMYLRAVTSNGEEYDIGLLNTMSFDQWKIPVYGVVSSSRYFTDLVSNLSYYLLDLDLNLPSGIKIWGSKVAFETQDEQYLVHVTGTKYINTTIDFTANSDYQNVASVIDVPVVGNMTVDEFIETIKDLAVDDTPAWIEAIDKITAVDVDTPGEDTKPTVPPLVSDFTADLTTLFPFCLPFDLIDLVKALSADPVAPKWEIPIKIKYGNVVNYKETFTIDMGNFDSVVKIFRTLETLGFIVGLIMITRNQMIKG